MNVKVCLDEEKFVCKPDKSCVKKINNRIAGQICSMSITDLARAIGEEGKTFCPSVFKYNHRKGNNFQEMQLFVLDFDSGVEYEVIREKCNEYELPIAFAYHTFGSSLECPKYRIVLCHAVPVKMKWLADMMYTMLKEIFPEADKACFEVARMFYGGKGVIESTEDLMFSADGLAYVYQRCLFEKDETNYARNIGRLAGRYGIGIKDKGIMNICTYQWGEMEEKEDNPIKDIIEIPPNSSKIVFYGKKETTHQHQINMCGQKVKQISHISQERICETCELSDRFFHGEYLDHTLKFLLATNFIQIKGMSENFLDVLRNDGDYKKYKKWKFDLRYMKAMQYKPQNCDENCPYAAECCHDVNLCLSLTGRRKIRKLGKAEPFVTLEESYAGMEQALKDAISARDQAIHLIDGQTGLGKSHAYQKLMPDLSTPTIIALPTVKLKNEIAGRLDGYVVEALSLKELDMPEEVAGEVQALYGRGLFKEAKKRICKYADEVKNPLKKKRYEKYLKFDEVLKKQEKHIVMTHAYLLQMSAVQLEGYNIIIDEDILATILRNTRSVSIADIKTAIQAGQLTGNIEEEMKQLLVMPDDSYLKPKLAAGRNYIPQEIQDRLRIYGNVNELFCAGALHRNNDTVEYFVPQNLPSKKIIIMSATLNETVYRLFFRERQIVTYHTPRARYKGHLKQYTYHSMSRNCMNELGKQYGGNMKIINHIKKFIPDWEYGISFKEYDSVLKGGMHFGNAAGIDACKGKNGIIIGTPHLNEGSYKLIACYLGGNMNCDSAKIRRMRVNYKEYEFNMMTYEDENLRQIQLYMISSELEQCIGRSRLLREDATVYLFSNFPCEQAELIQEDYLGGCGNEERADVPQGDISR